jgi:membrane protease YdiL (CAAX protease family)
VPTTSSSAENATSGNSPYWGYGDLGIFLLTLASLALGLRILARLHVVSKTQLSQPSGGLQVALALFLSAMLYVILKLRHRRPVLGPLGWVWPGTVHALTSLGTGGMLATSVLLYQHFESQGYAFTPSWQLLVLSSLLAPVLEESLFRGCLFPLVAKTTGDAGAILLTAGAFALFHGPTDMVHWISFVATGVAYGWLKVASGTTTAPALAHCVYNLILLSAATF